MPKEQMMVPTRFVIALVVAGLASVGVSAQTPDPFVGTWTLNVAKSQTTFKSGTTVVESIGGGIKTTADMVRGDGTADHFTWTAQYDGRDTPVIGASSYGAGGAHDRTHAHRLAHREDRHEAGWKGDDHPDACRLRRWQDPDDPHHGYGRQRPAGQYDGYLRKTVERCGTGAWPNI
jgi:hypothetical protein